MAPTSEQRLEKLRAFQQALQENEVIGSEKLMTLAKEAAALEKMTRNEPD